MPSASKQFPQKCSPLLSPRLQYSSGLEGDGQHFVRCCLLSETESWKASTAASCTPDLPASPCSLPQFHRVRVQLTSPSASPHAVSPHHLLTSYNTSRAISDFAMSREFLSVLTKSPQKGKEAGGKHVTAQCALPSSGRNTAGMILGALLRIAVCKGEEGRSPGITSSHSPVLLSAQPFPNPSYLVAFLPFRQCGEKQQPRITHGR